MTHPVVLVNGVLIPHPETGINVEVECPEEGGSVGHVVVNIKGGVLYVRHDGTASFTLKGDARPYLILGRE